MQQNEHSWLLEAIDRAAEEEGFEDDKALAPDPLLDAMDRAAEEAGLKEFEPTEPDEKALRAQVVIPDLCPGDGEVLVKRDPESGRITELVSKSYRRILNRDDKGRLIGYTEQPEKRA